MKVAREKAQARGATLDDVLWDEASWMVEWEMHK
jgi:hypothetical protein